MNSSYPRETIEWQGVNVTVDTVPVTTGVTLAIVPAGARPSAFTAPTILGGKIGVMLTGITPGLWDIWATVGGYAPETPCGAVRNHLHHLT